MPSEATRAVLTHTGRHSQRIRRLPATKWVVPYHKLWEIEISDDELKTHQIDRPVPLRSRAPRGMPQEIYGILVAHDAVRFLMQQAAMSFHIDPRRLGFNHAVRVLRQTAPVLRAAPAARLPNAYTGTIAHITQGRLPLRDHRVNPRVVKKKMSKFLKEASEHYRVQHPQTSSEQAVRVLK
ncbi:MAG: hypothetical protein JSV78_05220 [Phycisphaerales bacterium]|nr:MAG: hypothetical protein JSV78_05220 [Phycisphaerales bacterium]